MHIVVEHATVRVEWSCLLETAAVTRANRREIRTIYAWRARVGWNGAGAPALTPSMLARAIVGRGLS